MSLCLHDKTKTAETKIAKLGAGTVHIIFVNYAEFYVHK